MKRNTRTKQIMLTRFKSDSAVSHTFSKINRGFNAHFVSYIFNLFVFHLQVDVVGPLLLSASLLLGLTTDYSDLLEQVTELTDN